MIRDFSLAAGDICGDPTGLRVVVDDVDIYNYVHFSVLENSEYAEDDDGDAESGEMSHIAFVHRFTKLGSTFANHASA
jgi:hypothetical protein